MSNFNKNNLRTIFEELDTEGSVSLPKYINVKANDNNDSTSSFLPQKGGSFSLTSQNKNSVGDDEVNQLISMLTSDSQDQNNFSANSTQTEVLENRLRNMLQDGGAKKRSKKSKKQRGGAGNDDELRKLCDLVKSKGSNIQIDGKTCSEYFGDKNKSGQASGNTDTESLLGNFLASETAKSATKNSVVPGSLPLRSLSSLNTGSVPTRSATTGFVPTRSVTTGSVPTRSVPARSVDPVSITSADMVSVIKASVAKNDVLFSETSELPIQPVNKNSISRSVVPTMSNSAYRVIPPGSRYSTSPVRELETFVSSPTSTENGASARQSISKFILSSTSEDDSGANSPTLFPVYKAPSQPNNLLDASINASTTVVKSVAKSLSSTASKVVDDTISTASDVVTGTVGLAQGTVSGVVNTVTDVVSGVVDTAGDIVAGTVNTVSKVVSSVIGEEEKKDENKQSGGAKKRKSKKASKKSSKKGSKKGSRKGSKKSSKKGSKKMTGGSKRKSKKASKKSSKKGSRKGSKKMTGGGKRKSKKTSKKSSKKGSRKGSKKSSKKLSGGANAGFEAFLKLKKAASEVLGVSNGPAAGKAAGAAQKEVKADHPDWDAVKVSEEALKLIKANPSKYKEIATK